MTLVSLPRRFAAALLAGSLVLVAAPQGTASAQVTSRVLWQARDKMYGLGAAGLGTTMVLSPNGSTVYTAGSKDRDIGFALVAHDARTGARRWVSAFPADVGALDMAISPDGTRIFVAGAQGLHPAYLKTTAFDAATGARLWTASYLPNPSGSEGAPTTVAADGTRAFVTSGIPPESGNGYWDYGTLAYEAATGKLLWTARWNDADDLVDVPFAVAPNPDDQLVYVTGEAGNPSYFATVAYSVVDGSQMWVATTSGTGSEEARALALSPDGSRLYVAGWTGLDLQTRTVAYDAESGVELGEATYVAASPSSDVAVTPDGSRVYVAASTAIVAYDAMLTRQLWAAPEGRAGANRLVVSPDGTRVYSTGGTADGLHCGYSVEYDFATAALDASTGTALWFSRYRGLSRTSNDFGTDVAIAPDGSALFVSGQSGTCLGTDTAVATLSYRT